MAGHYPSNHVFGGWAVGWWAVGGWGSAWAGSGYSGATRIIPSWAIDATSVPFWA